MPEHGRMSTIRVQYGLRIKDLRDERGLSQRGFAALIGMSPTYLADIERRLREKFSTHVSVIHGDKKGRIEIEYYGDDDLDRILESLGMVEEI